MGIKLFSDAPRCTDKCCRPFSTFPNPDPFRFKIKRLQQVGLLVVAKITYPDATTFNGDKVLVFKMEAGMLKKRSGIDPHFLDNPSDPIARFPGNGAGWKNAMLFAKTWKT